MLRHVIRDRKGGDVMDEQLDYLLHLSEGGGFSGRLADQILTMDDAPKHIQQEFDEWLEGQEKENNHVR